MFEGVMSTQTPESATLGLKPNREQARELEQALAKVKVSRNKRPRLTLSTWTLNNSLEEIAALVHPEIRPVCKASIIDWPG
jgi:hypothetical protein